MLKQHIQKSTNVLLNVDCYLLNKVKDILKI